MASKKIGFNSKLIHAGGPTDVFGSAVTPIYQTSTFRFESADHGAACFAGESDGYIYSRIGNPTTRDLEIAIAELEGGYDAIGTSSGMSAVSTVYAALLSQGDHMISHNAVYGSSRVVMETVFHRFGIESSYIDTTDIDKVKEAIRHNTKLIYLETPANPTMGIADMEAICKLAKEKNIKVCVDNTFCSPYLQRPIEFGADIVLHSMTKFINGHADLVAGIIIPATQELYEHIRTVMGHMGTNIDPHMSFLARRGVKTLGIRIDRGQESAMKIAQWLEKHPKVNWVLYPGLPSHPQYELGKKQMDGPGCMLSFELKGGIEAGKIVMDNVKFCILAVSLGGIETLIQHPASMTHSKISEKHRLEAGITNGLVRLSIGIEDCDDIIADLSQALDLIG